MSAIYDTFRGWCGTEIQLKVDPHAAHRDFAIGESVCMADGVYAGLGGLVVVVGGIFVATFTEIHDKWGNAFATTEPPQDNNPVVQALRTLFPDCTLPT